MATRQITTTIALDGEQKFKQQIGEVNRELRNLGSEMKYTEEVFKGQANTTEALTAKSELLRKEIEQQQEKVRALEQAVKESADAYGDTDKKTDDWRNSLTKAKTELMKMENELKDTEKYLDEAERSLDGCAESIDEFGKAAEDTKSPLDQFKEQFGGIKNAIVGSAAVGAIKEVVGAVLELEESTREYRRIMGSLEVSSKQAGYSALETEEAYQHLYGVLGDAQTTATTLANLQSVGLAQKDLLKLIDQSVGAWGRYGDSIPIDGLAEAINETVRAGQVTGTFADVLNWGSKEGETFGVTLKENIEFTELSKKELEKLTEAQREEYEARKEQYNAILDYNESVQEATAAEDMFNIALQNCQTDAERTDLILRTLSEMGLDAAGQAWRDTNEDIVEANESQMRMEEAMGRLGEAVSPMANALRNAGAGAIEYFSDIVESATELVKGFFEWWDKFTNTEDAREAEERRIKQRTGLDVDVNPNTSRYKTGPSDTSAWSSRAIGLSWVPYDGFRAQLHEGEAVLTEAENRALSGLLAEVRGGTAGGRDTYEPGSETTETINITVQSVLDGRVLGESVTTYQKNRERATGR